MKLVGAHARAMTLELLRHPAYIVPTLLFPAVFFLFFASSAPRAEANLRMAGFAGFAMIGVAFFQFGVGIAAERASPWERYLRTLPVSVSIRMLARLASAALFAAGAGMVLIATAIATTSVSLSWSRWCVLLAALLAGTAPFALLGIALGYWAPARGALPIANLLYLGLSYAGGLWFSTAHLPGWLARISSGLPTRALSDALGAAVGGGVVPGYDIARLAGFAALFAAVGLLGYRRDQGRRYR